MDEQQQTRHASRLLSYVGKSGSGSQKQGTAASDMPLALAMEALHVCVA